MRKLNRTAVEGLEGTVTSKSQIMMEFPPSSIIRFALFSF